MDTCSGTLPYTKDAQHCIADDNTNLQCVQYGGGRYFKKNFWDFVVGC